MMNKIKRGVFFLLGVLYGWALEFIITHPYTDNPVAIIAGAIVFIGGFLILVGIIYFLIDNWDKQ